MSLTFLRITRRFVDHISGLRWPDDVILAVRILPPVLALLAAAVDRGTCNERYPFGVHRQCYLDHELSTEIRDYITVDVNSCPITGAN
jgi:hypothetical protein